MTMVSLLRLKVPVFAFLTSVIASLPLGCGPSSDSGQSQEQANRASAYARFDCSQFAESRRAVNETARSERARQELFDQLERQCPSQSALARREAQATLGSCSELEQERQALNKDLQEGPEDTKELTRNLLDVVQSLGEMQGCFYPIDVNKERLQVDIDHLALATPLSALGTTSR